MSQVINVNDALAIYTQFLQQQIQALLPAERNLGRLNIQLPDGTWAVFSFPQILSEVQRRTQVGQIQATSHARSLGFVVV